jgi:hypothetical protein
MREMRCIVFALFVLLTVSFSALSQEKEDFSKTLQLLQGSWVHQEDSLATVNVEDETWIFGYGENEITEADIYQIVLTDSLPNSKITLAKSEYILLIRNNDTLAYKIFGLTDQVLSKMFLPRGNMHVYLKQ